MTPRQREVYDLYLKIGNKREVARLLNLNESTVREAIKKAENHIDPSVANAMSGAGMQDVDILHSGWIKTENASLYFKMPKDDTTQGMIDRVRDAMGDISPIPEIAQIDAHNDDILTIYPLFDAHIGMRACKEDTGEEYTTEIAVNRLVDGVAKCVASAPSSKFGIILVGGDYLHHNDNTNLTQSGHVLDVDTRIDRTIGAAIDALAAAIEIAATKHEKVLVSVIQGNHDRDAYLAVMFAMMQRYRENPRIEVQKNFGDFFVMEFGLCLIAAHHGDKAKAERLVMHLALEWPEMWGRTRFRFYFTGHLHHAKMQDIGGVQVEQLRPVTPRDFYAASNAYGSQSQMQAITFHKQRGEISRIKVSL
jgi:predicted phosphodiesterase